MVKSEYTADLGSVGRKAVEVRVLPGAPFIYYFMLYTRRGDKGETTLFGSPKKISKDSIQFEALGALDELNSLLGICKIKAKKSKKIAHVLEHIQNDLFIIQAHISGSNKKLKNTRTQEIEHMIDEIEKQLPKIKGFTISGGTELSSLLDYARTVARRTERRIITLNKKNKVNPSILIYCNRLSSLLFALARLTHKGHQEKNPWY